MANNTAVPVLFDTEDYDTDGYHDTGSNTSRLTAKFSGYHRIYGAIAYEANATGTRAARIFKNNATNLGIVQGPASSAAQNVMRVGCTVFLAAGDYVELIALQNSGATRTAQAAAEYAPIFEIEYLGP